MQIPAIKARTGNREFNRFARVFFGRGVVIFGAVVILLAVFAAIFAPFIAPYDPYDQDLANSLLQPSWQHLLGTDPLGQDILSRLIFGSRNVLLVGLVSVGIASSLGMFVGLIAGYYQGWVYNILMRTIM